MYHVDGLVQERRNSSALAMELRLFLYSPIDVLNKQTWACIEDVLSENIV